MPRKKKPEPPPATAPIVPEYVTQSRLLQRRKVTKRKLPSFTEAMLLLHAPEVLRQYWEAIIRGLKDGDKTALELAGEMFNYSKGKGPTFNLTQQMMNQQVAAGESAPVMSSDALIRQIREAEVEARALPAPAEVIDAEFVRPADAVMITAEP